MQDMKTAAYVLLLRWLWLQQTASDQPWKDLDLSFGCDPVVAAMFQNSIDVVIGDGNIALFLCDRWNAGNSPCVAEPDLCKLIKPRVAKLQTVAQALLD